MTLYGWRIARPLLILSLTICVTSCSTCESSGGGTAPQTLLNPAAEGCPNPLLPLVKGAVWSYDVSSSPAQTPTVTEIEVLEITRKGSSLTAKLRKTVGNYKTTVEAFCNSEGSSFLPMYVYLGPPLPVALEYTPSVTKREGAMVPALERLRPGAEWEHSVVVHTERPGGTALTMDSDWSVSASYLGDREVTVPAGSYQAKQIKIQVVGHHRPPEEEDVVFSERVADPPAMVFTYSIAPGVGVVLIEAEPQADRPQIRPRWALRSISN